MLYVFSSRTWTFSELGVFAKTIRGQLWWQFAFCHYKTFDLMKNHHTKGAEENKLLTQKYYMCILIYTGRGPGSYQKLLKWSLKMIDDDAHWMSEYWTLNVSYKPLLFALYIQQLMDYFDTDEKVWIWSLWAKVCFLSLFLSFLNWFMDAIFYFLQCSQRSN